MGCTTKVENNFIVFRSLQVQMLILVYFSDFIAFLQVLNWQIESVHQPNYKTIQPVIWLETIRALQFSLLSCRTELGYKKFQKL